MKLPSYFSLLLIFCISCAFCDEFDDDEDDHSNEAFDSIMEPFPPMPPVPTQPPPPPPTTTCAPPARQPKTEHIGLLLSDIVKKSIADSKAMIDEAIKSAASRIAELVQEKMEQRLKRIETQAEENVLKFNGIALFMVEKFQLKTETVERKIAKSLDSISELVQNKLAKLEHATLRGKNSSKFINSTIKAVENYDCQGYKKLALLKVRYGKYFVSDNMTDWFGAKQYCEAQGMELVSFERASEMRAIWQLADASKEFMVSYWTSASDQGHARNKYHWRDGQSIESELWINGQPEDSDSSNGEPGCVSLFIGRLRATSCNYQRYFICEGLKHEKGSALNQKLTHIAD